MRWFLGALAALLLMTCLPLPAAARLNVAVLEFDEPGAGDQPSGLGRLVAEEFMYAVQASPAFSLLSMDRVFDAQARLGVGPGDHCRAARKVGAQAGADAVLCGAVTPMGSQARIDAYLVDVATGRTLWSDSRFTASNQGGFTSLARGSLAAMEAAAAGPGSEVAEAEPEPEIVEPAVVGPDNATAPDQGEDNATEPLPAEGPEAANATEPQLAEGPDAANATADLAQSNATEPQLAEAGPNALEPGPDNATTAMAQEQGNATAALEPGGYESEPFDQELRQRQAEEQESMDRERALLELELPFPAPVVGGDNATAPSAAADSRRVISQCAAGRNAEVMLADLTRRVEAFLSAGGGQGGDADARFRLLLQSERERVYGLIRARYEEVAQAYAAGNGYGAIVDSGDQGAESLPDVTDALIRAMDDRELRLPGPPPLGDEQDRRPAEEDPQGNRTRNRPPRVTDL